MASTFKTALIAAVAAAAVSAGAAVATTQAFTLGTTNRVDAPSTVVNVNGNGATSPVDAPLLTLDNRSSTANATPLALLAAPNHPALKVNTGIKVTNLNADRLDGIDSAGFVPSSAVQRFDALGSQPDPTFSAHLHTFATVGSVQIDGVCIDTGSQQVVTIALFLAVDHVAFAAVSQSDVSGYSPSTDAYKGAVWDLGRVDAAHGTPVFRTTTGTVLLPNNHYISFNLFMGQNIRGQTDGRCIWGGSALVN
jgi:hypothetical protein